jgi:alkylation response protein AidB-like acyl-CoA dehydrogenase
VDDLIAAAAALAPVIREGAEEGDRERRLPARVAKAMAEAGLYRAASARSRNGLELDPISNIRVIEEVSAADGAAGWNLMIGNETAGIASGGVSDAGAAEVYGDPRVIMSGALNPLGRSTRVPGGWRVSGRWPFASGCHNASWFWCGTQIVEDGAVLANADGSVRAFQLFVPAGDWRIVDTWDVQGLRGSGSHDIEMRDVFVPDERTTDVNGRGMVVDTPLFRYPLASRLCYNKVGVATGIARSAIAEFVALAKEKVPFTTRHTLAERPHAQLAAAEADVLLGSGRAFLLELVAAIWADVCAGRPPAMELRVRQRLAASHAVESAVRAVELVHRSAGATANFRSSPLERQFRDVHVVRAHTTVNTTVYESAGRALLGREVAPGTF